MSDDTTAVASFDDMPLHQNLLRGIYSYGFEKPSVIQQRAIVPFIRGGDMVLHSSSGSGKTGAYAIGVLQRVKIDERKLQAVVLQPTRELAQQVHVVISSLGEYLGESRAFCYTLVGGQRFTKDLKRAECCAVVAVCTPGRMADIIERGALDPASVCMLVLDEVLGRGFDAQIARILRSLPLPQVQLTVCCSKMLPDVEEFAKTVMRDPTHIAVATRAPSRLDNILQFHVRVEEEQKFDTLLNLYACMQRAANTIIMCSGHRRVDWFSEQLRRRDYDVTSLYADTPPKRLEELIASLRHCRPHLVVANDCAVHGLDKELCDVIFNVDMPRCKHGYFCRIGRRAPSDVRTLVINFVTAKDAAVLKDIESHFDITIGELPLDFDRLCP